MNKKLSHQPHSNEAVETSSSNEEMETESDEESSSGEESPPTSRSFTLPLLQDEGMSEKLNKYLATQPFSSKKLLLSKKSTETISPDFVPWWESFNHTLPENNPNRKNSHEASTTTGNGLYDSWFERASTSDESHTWLSGPKSKLPDAKDSAPIEDIEVPSIYSKLSKPMSKRAMKKERKAQSEKTTGKKWFDMKLPEMDSKTKMDMEMLQMRRALNSKNFFKQNDRDGIPKYFQLGSVVDEGTDFYSSRLTKKQRKQTLVEELMADANVRQYNKKKYEEVQQNKRRQKGSRKKKII